MSRMQHKLLRRFDPTFALSCPKALLSRRFSTEFLQLFGRLPTLTPPLCSRLAVTEQTTKHSPPNAHLAWQQQLECFENEIYSNPNHADAIVCQNTLQCLKTFLAQAAHRKAASVETLWQQARRVLLASHLGGQAPVHNIADTAFVFYYCRRYSECKKLTDTALDRVAKDPPANTLSTLEYRSFLQLLSLHVLCSMQLKHRADAKAQAISIALLSQSMKLMHSAADKGERRLVTSSIELLFYTYDWAYHFDLQMAKASTNAPEELLAARLRPLAPKWMGNIFTSFRGATKAVLAEIAREPQGVPPSFFIVAGKEAEACGDVGALRVLLDAAIKREENSLDICVFGLSISLAEIFLGMQKSGGAFVQRVIDYTGTSLSTDTLAAVGSTAWGYAKSLHWLTQMCGPGAYFAIKKVLFHKGSSEMAAMQESCGDVLTGNRHANWRQALAQTQSSLSVADSSWRRQLPTTLRLLSDAGRKKEFFELITEYDSKDLQSNLMVAASLAQMLRLSGKWQHCIQVVDLITSSHIPQTKEADMFLQDACLQTMYALRNAKRWEEALSIYSVMHTVMPPQVHRLMCFMICDMPTSSSWQSALHMLLSVASIPSDCAKTLACMYGNDTDIPQSPRQRKYVLEGLIRVGRWKVLLEFVKLNSGSVDGWVSFFKASEVSEEVMLCGSDLLRQIPLSVWRNEKVLKQAFIGCLANGCLAELDAVLTQISVQCPLSNEVRELIRFLAHGKSSKAALVADSYLGHCFTSFVSACNTKTRVRTDLEVVKGLKSSSVDLRSRLAAWFKVPDLCIACAQSGSEASYYIRPFPFVDSIPKQLLYANDEVVVAYKPSGVSVQSAARSILRMIGACGAYRIGLLMPPGASGLFFLRKALVGLKGCVLSLQIEMELVPYGDYAVPLLSTNFFTCYSMVFLGSGRSESVVKLRATFARVSLALLNDAVRGLKVDLNSEGWTFSEENVNFGDSYRVTQLDFFDLRSGAHLCLLLPQSFLEDHVQ